MESSDINILPGQKVETSIILRHLFKQAKDECNRNIVFNIAPTGPYVDFEGQAEWRDHDVLIQINGALDSQMAEYIAAHELGHAIQFARGYPILVGNAYRPATTTIAKRISNFLLDSSADAIAVQYGFPMAPSFERYLELNEVRGIVNNLKNGGSQGDNWARIWEYIEETIISEALQNKLSRIPRDLNTLLVASTFANIVQRASNLGLTIGYQVLNDIKRFPLLSRVIDDLLNIGTPSGICSIGELLSKLKRVFDYLKPKPGQLSIYKPLTDQILH